MDRWDWMFAIGILACAIGAGWWLHPAAGLIIIGLWMCGVAAYRTHAAAILKLGRGG